MKIKAPLKIAIAVVVSGSAIFGVLKYRDRPQQVGELKTAGKVALPDAPEATLGTAAVKLELPSQSLATTDGLHIKWDMMAWQSQNGAILANGGANTTAGSLFEQAGLHVEIARQDNCMVSSAAMVQYCKDYKEGKTKDGYFVTYMASGTDVFLTNMFDGTKDLGPEYQAVAWLTFGKSFGEDQVIGSPDIKANKKLLAGKVLRGVKLDGDIDLALKLCTDNDVKVNANPKLYYPDALNLSYVSSDNGTFLTAVQDYNSNLQETRKIVRNGVTGKDTTVTIDLVATWTPGDVNAANGRGGATIISTKDYSWVMPNITITSRKFLNDNREKMKNIVYALASAGDQIRSYQDVSDYACTLGQVIWNENDAAYWIKYYKGENKGDMHLGGSKAFNLKDMAFMFGLDGSRDNYKDIYNNFGKLHTFYYKDEYPTFAPYEKVVDKSIMRDVWDAHKDEASLGNLVVKDNKDNAGQIVGSKSYSITFATGSAAITETPELQSLLEQVGTSAGLEIVLEGHTDNTGNESSNQTLSEQRAEAVKQYLVKKGVASNTITSAGFGSTKPIAENTTAAGKAKNRRVQVILKN